VSVTQLPLIYCLGGKINVISLVTGVSYGPLNWLHRWIARTLFLAVIVHWSFFLREWWIADFVKLELEMIPVVKFGFGAW
jgi:Ferric reductase like transmembrane component